MAGVGLGVAIRVVVLVGMELALRAGVGVAVFGVPVIVRVRVRVVVGVNVGILPGVAVGVTIAATKRDAPLSPVSPDTVKLSFCWKSNTDAMAPILALKPPHTSSRPLMRKISLSRPVKSVFTIASIQWRGSLGGRISDTRVGEPPVRLDRLRAKLAAV
jgi:hypothetical protein